MAGSREYYHQDLEQPSKTGTGIGPTQGMVASGIIGHLQPFGRIAYVTNRDKLKAKLDARAKKCVFVGYAQDHSGDTYKFYNLATKQTIMSHDVHQWMEWHGRITATNSSPSLCSVIRHKMNLMWCDSSDS